MSKKMLVAAAAALSFTATPVLAAAQPAPASKLSLAGSTRAAKATGPSEKLEGNGAIIAAVLAAGVVAGGIIAIANDDDDSDSN
ncbi:hypothetical protein [Sphingomonas rubra]|uniref:Uncharacterized protein n=1 Tax=Sphingomonas rubra TaxID=634430 RepID=A0A1I5PRX8_9SPHN|nr:hypothetical protein [Sphingomonas rubra]SFP36600.1 hypothetical protein SAMN04488241_101180 [Sphingomonas rubra]